MTVDDHVHEEEIVVPVVADMSNWDDLVDESLSVMDPVVDEPEAEVVDPIAEAADAVAEATANNAAVTEATADGTPMNADEAGEVAEAAVVVDETAAPVVDDVPAEVAEFEATTDVVADPELPVGEEDHVHDDEPVAEVEAPVLDSPVFDVEPMEGDVVAEDTAAVVEDATLDTTLDATLDTTLDATLDPVAPEDPAVVEELVVEAAPVEEVLDDAAGDPVEEIKASISEAAD